MKRFIRVTASLVFALLLVISATACRGNDPTPDTAAPSAPSGPLGNSSAADESLKFSAKDLGGVTVTESVFKDHALTMVNVWGTFCGPCIREMPELGQLSKDLESEGFQIIGIITDSVAGGFVPINYVLEDARSIILQTGADYRHLIPSESLYDRFLQGVSAVPTTFFVDSDGRTIGDPYVGSRSYAQWKAVIDPLLSGIR